MLALLLAAIYTVQGWQGEESQTLKRTLSFNLIPLFQGRGERVQIFKIKQNKCPENNPMKTLYLSVSPLDDRSRELSVPFWLGYVGDVLLWGLSLCFGFIICLLYACDVMNSTAG